MNVITSKGQKLKTNKRGRINFTALDILAGFNSDAMKQSILKLTIVDNLIEIERDVISTCLRKVSNIRPSNSVFQSSITGSKELRGELGHHQIDL